MYTFVVLSCNTNALAFPLPATFYPGELVDIYVHVLRRDAKFTGLLMNAIAVDHNDTKIGKWEFGQADPNPLYWFGLPTSLLRNFPHLRLPPDLYFTVSTDT